MERIRFVKVREVKSPNRGNEGDAGIDFYVPEDLEWNDLKGHGYFVESDIFHDKVTTIGIKPHGDVLIPSGIKALIEPKESELTAVDKSGVSTEKKLIIGAKVVDSTYIGEINIHLINIGDKAVYIEAGDKVAQFIHRPIYPTKPEEITIEEFNSEAENWSTRGDGGFGSTGNK